MNRFWWQACFPLLLATLSVCADEGDVDEAMQPEEVAACEPVPDEEEVVPSPAKVGECEVCASLDQGEEEVYTAPNVEECEYYVPPAGCCSNTCLAVANDTYIEGYLQGLIDEHFGEYHINICVEGCTVYISHMPNNCDIVRGIVQFVRDFPGVNCVVVDKDCLRCRPVKHPTPYQDCYRLNGIWFPQKSVLFKYLVADPRQIRFGAGYRFHDDVFGSRIGCANFGNIFPIFRWVGVGPMCGDMQISIEGGVFAIFQFDPVAREIDGDSVALVNADYEVGIPLTYAYGNWSYRLRLYHISSHLGDEFMVNNPDVLRLNPSREMLDLFASWQPCDAIRLYGGVGWVYHSNDSFKIAPFYVEYGFEMRLPGQRDLYQCLYYKPLLACHFRNWQDWSWQFDATYVLGLEWSKVRGLGQKMRTYFEYHDGFSLEGQFAKLRTTYFSVNISFGW